MGTPPLGALGPKPDPFSNTRKERYKEPIPYQYFLPGHSRPKILFESFQIKPDLSSHGYAPHAIYKSEGFDHCIDQYPENDRESPPVGFNCLNYYSETCESIVPDGPGNVGERHDAFNGLLQLHPRRVEVHTLWLERHFVGMVYVSDNYNKLQITVKSGHLPKTRSFSLSEETRQRLTKVTLHTKD